MVDVFCEKRRIGKTAEGIKECKNWLYTFLAVAGYEWFARTQLSGNLINSQSVKHQIIIIIQLFFNQYQQDYCREATDISITIHENTESTHTKIGF